MRNKLITTFGNPDFPKEMVIVTTRVVPNRVYGMYSNVLCLSSGERERKCVTVMFRKLFKM